jgi:pilus assembly protein Flp/PilA
VSFRVSNQTGQVSPVRARSAPSGDDGASAVEYGLIVFAIAALIVVIVFALGRVVGDLFGRTCDKVTTQTSAPDKCS